LAESVVPDEYAKVRKHGRELMRPIDKIKAVSGDMPAMEALQMMGREDVNQLPVISNGRVEGIVTRATLLEC
jgi:CBS domain-containing protein